MEVATVSMERYEADRLYREYQKDKQFQTEVDREIARTYHAISKGKVVIQAMESCKRAGLNAQGLPVLAIGRADLRSVRVSVDTDGHCIMRNAARNIGWRNAQKQDSTSLFFPTKSFQATKYKTGLTTPPPIPLNLRPKTALDAYHILWEAEYDPIPPRDPYLLRRIGKGDLWLVVAQWDLTDVERAALATRVMVT